MPDFKRYITEWFAKPWYPLAISAYPVLALLAANAGQVEAGVVIRPLLVSIAFGAMLYLLTWIFFRNANRAAFLTMLLLALFFSYGHAYIYIDQLYPESNYTTW